MLSALSSFLPSSAQASSVQDPKPSAREAKEQESEEEPTKKTEISIDEMNVRKKRERSNETFIIVRPPPSKSNHPLNLQVQLVPPSARDRSTMRSLDASDVPSSDNTSTGLSRTATNRSDTSSLYSTAYSSVASLSSMASTSSTSSGRRMIIPLYNLQAHNVMTNVIVDAGTDAKVAKFGKRGMEVLGLAVIEPIEVFGTAAAVMAGLLGPGGQAGADQSPGLMHITSISSRGHTPEPAYTPDSSALSLSDTSHHAHFRQQSVAVIDYPATSTPTPSGAKKMFGKLFKKKEAALVPPPTPTSPAMPTSPTTPKPASHIRNSSVGSRLNVPAPGSSKRSSLLGPPSQDQNPGQPNVLLQPAVLGLQPALSAPTYPPHGRPTMYVWVVRKWLKGTDNGLFGGMMGMMDKKREASENIGVTLGEQVELRFEWKRGKHGHSTKRKRSRKGQRPLSSSGIEGSASPSRRASLAMTSSDAHSTTSVATEEQPGQSRREKRTSMGASSAVQRRRSVDSHRSLIARAALGDDAQSFITETATDDEPDDGAESDPEDSETPWVCTVAAKRVAAPSSYASYYSTNKGTFEVEGQGGRPAEEVKVKVAQLKPTPHHPKVIALLKMPFPLPDIEVDKVHLRKRVLTPSGVARPVPEDSGRENSGTGKSGTGAKGFFSSGNIANSNVGGSGLVLTAEEIKDIVSSTCMWLIVREGIGGVGKVTRKGDGWRIRP